MPSPTVAEEMFRWVEAGAEDRNKLTGTARVAEDPLPPEPLAEAVLNEGKQRLKENPASPVGVALIQGVLDRWAETPAAAQARAALQAFTKESGKSTEDLAEEAKRKYRRALAVAIEKYLTALEPAALDKVWDVNDDGRYGKETAEKLRDKAVSLWTLLRGAAVKQKKDDEVREADKHLADLKKIKPKRS